MMIPIVYEWKKQRASEEYKSLILVSLWTISWSHKSMTIPLLLYDQLNYGQVSSFHGYKLEWCWLRMCSESFLCIWLNSRSVIIIGSNANSNAYDNCRIVLLAVRRFKLIFMLRVRQTSNSGEILQMLNSSLREFIMLMSHAWANR